MKRIVLITSLITLNGCALVDSTQKADGSRESYRTCLQTHTKNPRACESAKLLYETDKDHLQNLRMSLSGLTMGNESHNNAPVSRSLNCTTMAMGPDMATTNCN